jgi:hypothetical protein
MERKRTQPIWNTSELCVINANKLQRRCLEVENLLPENCWGHQKALDNKEMSAISDSFNPNFYWTVQDLLNPDRNTVGGCYRGRDKNTSTLLDVYMQLGTFRILTTNVWSRIVSWPLTHFWRKESSVKCDVRTLWEDGAVNEVAWYIGSHLGVHSFGSLFPKTFWIWYTTANPMDCNEVADY